MKRFWRLAAAFIFGIGIVLITAQGVLATCHSFSVTVSPETVAEGSSVTVVVQRNAGLSPSSVQVTSVEENATSGVDYEKVDRRIEFTTETRQAFVVGTKNDSSSEAVETFLVRLSNGSGCEIKQEAFKYGSAARVTIQDNDSVGGSAAGIQAAQRKNDSLNPSLTPTADSLSPTPQESAASDGTLATSPEFSQTYLPSAFPLARKPSTHLSKWIIAAVLAAVSAGGLATTWWLWRKKATDQFSLFKLRG